VTVVKEAEQQGRRVRAVGSSWSNSDIACVTTSDYLVETDELNSVVTDILSASPGILNDSALGLKFVHVEAGIKLVDLNRLLDKRDLAMKALGGSTGQSLAGALSTGVHGSDFDRGTLPDVVRAIHLVGPGGIQHWIEPTVGITKPSGLAAILGSDCTIHYNDDWFYSALVSMGSLGIIYSLIIEVEAQYDLIENCEHVIWDTIRESLRVGTPFAGKRAVQVVVSQFKHNDGTRPAFLTTRVATAKTKAQNADPLASLYPMVAQASIPVLNANHNLYPDIVKGVLFQALTQGSKQGWAHTIMSSSAEPPAKGLTLEVAFDATKDAYLGFVDAALRILDDAYQLEQLGWGGWISLRFQGHSRAYLVPQHQSTRTCTIEFAAAAGLNSTRPLLARLEAEAKARGGIQHWGMFNDLTAADVERAYPKLDTFRRIRREITNGGTNHTFDNDFTIRCGLARPPRPFPAIGRVRSGSAVALVRQTPGWASAPVAAANGDGSWKITNGPAPDFITDWAHQPGVTLVPGDFNGNGLTDIALVCQTPGWNAIPIAFAQGDGSWKITNGPAPGFITDWAHQPGVRVVFGDFNGDGRTDIALVRQTPGWGSIPIAFAKGDGTWEITNGAAPDFITDWAHQPGMTLVPGDFNGNGLTDIALVCQTPGWSALPIAFAQGDGTWNITNEAAPNFIADWAHQPGVRLVSGNFAFQLVTIVKGPPIVFPSECTLLRTSIAQHEVQIATLTEQINAPVDPANLRLTAELKIQRVVLQEELVTMQGRVAVLGCA
jgi:hypothetical protein